MTSDHRNTEPMRMGGIEVVAPSYDVSDGSAGNGSAAGDLPVINGTAVSGEDKAASDRAGESEPAVVDRSHVPPGVLQSMRGQLADLADFTHRSRITPNSGDNLQALGCGGGITAAVVEQMAAVLFGKKAVALLGADQRTLNDTLLLSLVAPEEPTKLTESQRELFISWRGRLALDVSMAKIGPKPVTTLVNLNGNLAGPCAAVIVGSAAFIAGDRPYLSLDHLMTYARGEVYRSAGPAGVPPTQAAGLQAVRNLEIVLLLDRSLGGGLWIDVDSANGRPTAALAVGLSSEEARARFTHMPDLRIPELRTLAAGIATA